jgi:quinoprotein glucose dehydrogenase
MNHFGAVLLAAALSPLLSAQSDWPAYGHDAGGIAYSPLSQINSKNVGLLRAV